MIDRTGPAWDDLAREFDRWEAADGQPTLWWRDDDAVEATPALARLQAVARVPVALAVIPAAPERPLRESLAGVVAGWPGACVLQHGIAHRNNAAAGEKKSEFPATPSAETVAALGAGQAALRRVFGQRFLPVLTPPWNRIAPVWLPLLPDLGFAGLSRFGAAPYAEPQPQPGLLEINTHVDVIDWRGSRGFAGTESCLGRLAAHLAARRTGLAGRDRPTGVLTHHLVHDTATWRFLENLQDWLARRGEAGSRPVSGGLSCFVSAVDLWSPGFTVHA